VDFYIGAGEIGSLGKKWFAGKFGQSVGKAVAEVERGGVSSPPVFAPGRPREISLLSIDGYDLEIGAYDEEIELASSRFALSGFKDDPSFKHARCRYQPASCGGDGGKEFLALRFSEKDGHEGGRINDHELGSARESVLVITEDFVCGAFI